MIPTLRITSLTLLALSIFSQNLRAQGATSTPSIPKASLSINVVEGENAVDNIRTAREPVVQVVDQNRAPVSGAVVTFTDVAGETGAGADFGGAASYKTVTDGNGKAAGRGFNPNGINGPHKIEVSAALGSLASTIAIHRKNVSEGAAVATGGGLAAFFSSAPQVTVGVLGTAGTVAGVYLGVLKGNSDVVKSAVSAPTPLTPVSAPEIDPSISYGCLMMLAGATAVLRGKKRA